MNPNVSKLSVENKAILDAYTRGMLTDLVEKDTATLAPSAAPTTQSDPVVAAIVQKPTSVGKRFKLSPMEEVAVAKLITPERALVDQMLFEVLVWAEALDDPARRDENRVRLVAKTLAASRAKQLYLEGVRDWHLERNSIEMCRLVQRALDSETRRFGMLLVEHRLNCTVASAMRPVSVSVGAVQGNVNIAAVPGGT